MGLSRNDERAYCSEVDNLVKWCEENHLSLNINKTKDMVIDFQRQMGGPHSHPTQGQQKLKNKKKLNTSGEVFIQNQLDFSPTAHSRDTHTETLLSTTVLHIIFFFSWLLNHILFWIMSCLCCVAQPGGIAGKMYFTFCCTASDKETLYSQ